MPSTAPLFLPGMGGPLEMAIVLVQVVLFVAIVAGIARVVNERGDDDGERVEELEREVERPKEEREG